MCWTLMAAFGDRARRTLIGTASPRTCSGRIHLGRWYGSDGGVGGGGGSKNARQPSYRWRASLLCKTMELADRRPGTLAGALGNRLADEHRFMPIGKRRIVGLGR